MPLATVSVDPMLMHGTVDVLLFRVVNSTRARWLSSPDHDPLDRIIRF